MTNYLPSYWVKNKLDKRFLMPMKEFLFEKIKKKFKTF